MLGWLKSKIQKASTDAMRDDLERFVISLQGASSQEAGDVLMMATLVRLKMEAAGDLSPSSFELSSYTGSLDEDLLALRINRFIGGLQKQGNPELAAGAMVWLHTARVIQNPQLRLLGRAMWKELQRGLPRIDEQRFEEGIQLGHLPQDIQKQVRYVPGGLEPEIT